MLVVFFTAVLASEPASAPPMPETPIACTHNARPTQELRRARSLKIAGEVTTGVGIAFGAFGAGLGIAGGVENSGMVSAYKGFFGVVSTGIGLGIITIGVPMWVAGARREHLPVELVVAPAFSPHGGGLTLGGRF